MNSFSPILFSSLVAYQHSLATDAYNEFHNRSPIADKWLKSLPSRADEGKSGLDDELDPLTKDYHGMLHRTLAETR